MFFLNCCVVVLCKMPDFMAVFLFSYFFMKHYISSPQGLCIVRLVIR